MNDTLKPRKKLLITPELWKENPLWFKGAIAYRLLRIMTPKPLTRRLPRILRQPLLLPGFSFPPDWFLGDILPPGIILPEDVYFPPGWQPGDPLPEGTTIDTSMLLPDTWLPGDPVPDFVILPPTAFFPPDWTPSDPLPEPVTIDTGIVFPPDWTPGDPLPPSIFIPPDVPWPPLWKPGDPLPDGAVIDPEILFPVVWMLGDPLPPSIILTLGIPWPPLWKPGDPLPEGTTIDTGKLFPPGWQPGDPNPDGTIPAPYSFDDLFEIDSPVPPIYISPSESNPSQQSKTTPPVTDPWQQKFDNTFWEVWDSEGTWNATLNRWDHVGDAVVLQRIGTWAIGYRPEMVRVTHLGTAQSDLAVENEAEETLAQDINSPSLTEVTITFPSADPSDDIFYLYIMSDHPTITNIEFYVP